MRRFLHLFELTSGRPLPEEEQGTASRMQIVIHATIASIFFGALYGLAAGSTDLGLALSNVYKIPMVVLPVTTAVGLGFPVYTEKVDVVVFLRVVNLDALSGPFMPGAGGVAGELLHCGRLV